MNITIEFCIFKLVLVPNFSLNWQFWFFFYTKFVPKSISNPKQKTWTSPLNSYNQVNLGIKFHFKQFWIVGPNFPKKGVSGLKQKKWTSPANSAYSTKFQIKLTILIFWDNFSQKDVSSLKQKKRGSPLNFTFWISLANTFQWKLTVFFFSFFIYIFSESLLPVENRKSKYHHWILHIRISQSTKF